jgi:hypothetical protein
LRHDATGAWEPFPLSPGPPAFEGAGTTYLTRNPSYYLTNLTKKSLLLYMSAPFGGQPPLKFSELFLSEVPGEVLAALLRTLLQSYQDASSACYDVMRPPQAKEASGPFRRNKIESELMGVGERFSGNLSVESKHYKRHTGSYVELTCGLVKMTQSCVLAPSDLPREADYRETLATHPQLLLEFMPREPEGKFLYAILLHGVDDTVRQRAGCRFAEVRFPLRGFTGYTEERVDLFAMFPEIVAEYTGQTAAEEDAALLPIRVVPKTGEA